VNDMVDKRRKRGMLVGNIDTRKDKT